MVQNNDDAERKRRGRPRAYDPETALRQIRDVFWQAGYSGASLDELSAATGMNRPSLYAAFGDKRALYLKALAGYWRLAFADMREAMAGDHSLDDALMRIYEGTLSIYFSGTGAPRGCFVMGTAVTEAVEDADVRMSLAEGFRAFDASFEALFRAARETGELTQDADPAALALLATATMHTIAVRARCGISRDELWEVARKAVAVICGRRLTSG